MLSLRRTLLGLSIVILCGGCNMNESKEARIQKLESLNAQNMDTIAELEARIAALESQTQLNHK